MYCKNVQTVIDNLQIFVFISRTELFFLWFKLINIYYYTLLRIQCVLKLLL